MPPKHRLSATVDRELIDAANAAVADGLAENVSDWVNTALLAQAAADRRRRALDDFFAEYEAEHGAFTEEEMDAAERRMRSQAVVVRGAPRAR